MATPPERTLLARPSARGAALERVRVALAAHAGIAPHPWRLADRAAERARARGTPLDEYAAALDGAEVEALFEQLRVAHSGFFRGPAEFIRIGEWVAGRPGARVWCAGVGDGQEAFSLVALAPHVQVLGTDLSRRAIAHARQGAYPREALEGVPAALRARFLDGAEISGDRVRLPDRLRGRVTFEVRNLLGPAPAGRFELIVCRNVLYHLDGRARATALERLAGALSAGGRLWVGERVEQPMLERLGSGLYARLGGP